MQNKLLRELADVRAGYPKRRATSQECLLQAPYLSVSNVQDGFMDLTSVKTMPIPRQDIDTYKLRPRDVLFTAGGDRDKLGRSAIWRCELPECLYQNHLFSARANENYLLPEFLSIYASSAAGVAYFASHTRGSTSLAHITIDCLRNFPIPMLPISKQRQIINLIWPIIEYLSMIGLSIRRCKKIRTKLRLNNVSNAPECLRAIDNTISFDRQISERLAQYRASLLSSLME